MHGDELSACRRRVHQGLGAYEFHETLLPEYRSGKSAFLALMGGVGRPSSKAAAALSFAKALPRTLNCECKIPVAVAVFSTDPIAAT